MSWTLTVPEVIVSEGGDGWIVIRSDGSSDGVPLPREFTLGEAEGSTGSVGPTADDDEFRSFTLTISPSEQAEGQGTSIVVPPEDLPDDTAEGRGTSIVVPSEDLPDDTPDDTSSDAPGDTLNGLASAADVGDLDLPGDLPPIIAEMADEWTGREGTLLGKALALEDLFSRSGLFSYSTSAPVQRGYEGDSLDVVARFLEARAGYCVHFASAMAVMARYLGIPSRIAVGYMPGRPTQELPRGQAVYSVTTRSLHAWPELYIEGYGWIGFEPTPGRAPGEEPAPVETAEPGLPSAPPSASPSPGASRSANPSPSPSRSAGAAGRPGDDAGTGVEWQVWPVLAAAAVLAALVSAGAARGLRRRRRWRAMAGGGIPAAGAAWAEVRDTAADLGLGAPVTQTPRVVAERLAVHYEASGVTDPEPDRVREALGKITETVEAAAYAPDLGDPPRREDVRLILRGLRRAVRRRRRFAACVFPISLVRGLIWNRRARRSRRR
jgi:transglutaminase-like putative cysteine protease